MTLAGSPQESRPGNPRVILHSWLLADAGFILADIFRRQALRANHIGEVVAFAGLAVCCIVAVAIGWRHADGGDRRLTRPLLGWFSALAFCAVVLDILSSVTRRSRFGGGFAVLEDGGEMIVMSFLVMSVWATLQPAAPVGRALRPGDVS